MRSRNMEDIGECKHMENLTVKEATKDNMGNDKKKINSYVTNLVTPSVMVICCYKYVLTSGK